MREFGYALIAVGVIWLLVAFNMDTSVATGGGLYAPDRVENIGLISRRQNHLFVAGLVILVGVLMAIFGGKKDPKPHSAEAAPASSREPPAERDLEADGYRLWLADTYGIKKNEVFDRFVIGDHTFATLDEALAYAHAKEEEKLQAADEERLKREKAREEQAEYQRLAAEQAAAEWDRLKPKLIAGSVVTAAAIAIAYPFVSDWFEKREAERLAEEAMQVVELNAELAGTGLSVMEGARNAATREVSRTEVSADRCDHKAGTLVTFNTPTSWEEVVNYYNQRLPNGRNRWSFESDPYLSSDRIYEMDDGSEVHLRATATGNTRANVSLCKTQPR